MNNANEYSSIDTKLEKLRSRSITGTGITAKEDLEASLASQASLVEEKKSLYSRATSGSGGGQGQETVSMGLSALGGVSLADQRRPAEPPYRGEQ